MATYYVNPENGLDYYDGSDTTPWKTLRHAGLNTVTGDVIYVVSPQYMVRDDYIQSFSSGVSINCDSNLKLLMTEEVSHGTNSNPIISNGGLDAWSNGTPDDIDVILGTGALLKESLITSSPGNSAKITRTGGTFYIESQIYLEAGEECTLLFDHYETEGSYRFKISIIERGAVPDNYLQASGMWASTGYIFDDVGNSINKYATYSKLFTSNGAGYYAFSISLGHTTTSYIDNIRIICNRNNLFSQYSGDIYKLNRKISNRVKILLKSSSFNVDDPKSLVLARVGTNKDSLAPGEWTWDSGYLYYRVDIGESIYDLHIEISKSIRAKSLLEDGVTINKDNYIVSGVTVIGSGRNNFYGISGTGGQLVNCHSLFGGEQNVGNGFLLSSSTELINCSGWYDGTKNILVSGGSVTMTRCFGSYAYSGGFYAYGGGSMECIQCVAHAAGRENADNNAGFCAHSGGVNNMILEACLAVGCYGRDISVGGSGTVSVINSIGHGSVLGYASAHYDPGFTGEFNHQNNCFDSYYGGWIKSENEIQANPLLSADYHLRTDSPCLGAGTKISGINTDVEGNPLFPPYNIGPYGMAAGALGIAPMQYQGPPRNNITRLTGTSTTIDPAETYILADTDAWRIVTGWTAGTANFAFDSSGIPTSFTGQQLIDAGIGPRLYCGSKGVAGYVVDQDAPTNAKIIKILKVPTYIDTLYWADYQEFNWEPTSGE